MDKKYLVVTGQSELLEKSLKIIPETEFTPISDDELNNSGGEPSGNDKETPTEPNFDSYQSLFTKNNLRVAVIVGHDSKDKGSVGTYLSGKLQEYDYNKVAAEYLEKMGAKVFFRDPKYSGSYSTQMSDLIGRINKSGTYDVSLELHFDSYKEAYAHGSSVLHFFSNTKSKEFGLYFLSHLESEFGLKSRGLIPIRKESERGGYGIVNSKGPYMLLEPFFGSNVEDCRIMDNEQKYYAELIARCLMDKINLFK